VSLSRGPRTRCDAGLFLFLGRTLFHIWAQSARAYSRGISPRIIRHSRESLIADLAKRKVRHISVTIKEVQNVTVEHFAILFGVRMLFDGGVKSLVDAVSQNVGDDYNFHRRDIFRWRICFMEPRSSVRRFSLRTILHTSESFLILLFPNRVRVHFAGASGCGVERAVQLAVVR